MKNTNQILSMIAGDVANIANENDVKVWILSVVIDTFQEGNHFGRDFAFSQLDEAIDDGFTTQEEINACEKIVENFLMKGMM